MELRLGDERPQYNPINGRFLKGHVPHNKGKKWSEWMDGRKQKKVRRILKKNIHGRHNIGGWNKRAVIMLDNEGNHAYFESSAAAGRATGITARNIRYVCDKKRKHAGGYRWFWFDDNDWTEYINNKNK